MVNENCKVNDCRQRELNYNLAACRARCAELEEQLGWMLELYDHANRGAFENGVTDQTGLDEGNVVARRIAADARAVLAKGK